MKHLIITLALLILLTGCSSAPVAERSNAALQETSNPTYPIYAVRNKIEGYVEMTFDISKSGEPINISVLKSIPEGVFDKAAIKALSNWRYAPKIENGVPVQQTKLKVRLDFKLD